MVRAAMPPTCGSEGLARGDFGEGRGEGGWTNLLEGRGVEAVRQTLAQGLGLKDAEIARGIALAELAGGEEFVELGADVVV